MSNKNLTIRAALTPCNIHFLLKVKYTNPKIQKCKLQQNRNPLEESALWGAFLLVTLKKNK